MTTISFKKRSSVLFLCAGALSPFAGDLRGATLTPFDPPGSIQTGPVAINSAGDVTGWFTDASNVTHSFLRLASGSIITFELPEAVLYGTRATAINDSDQITGAYTTNQEFDAFHGFLRENNGTVTTFDPAAGTTGSGTNPTGINASGDITGYTNTDLHNHGFLRKHDGTITVFDVPNGANTSPVGINTSGVISGSYSASNGEIAFVRAANGTFVTYGIPNPWANEPAGVNESGAVPTNLTSDFCLRHLPFCIPGQERAYIREASGLITPVLVQPKTSLVVTGINGPGQVIGAYYPSGTPTGFVRETNGTYTTFSGPGLAIVPAAINNSGTITGIYEGNDGQLHGFVRTP